MAEVIVVAMEGVIIKKEDTVDMVVEGKEGKAKE